VTLFADYLITYVSDGAISDYLVGSGATGAALRLSNATIGSLSSVGTVVGNFSVTGGSTRAYTFTLTAGTSNFSVGGSTLSVSSDISIGLESITAKATDTGTSVITGSFLINVISTAAVSGFVPTFELFGF